jgi:hypothetical protein
MLVSSLGFLLCLALGVGAWIVNEPATNAVIASLELADSYLALAEGAIARLDSELSKAEQTVAGFATTSQERGDQIQDRLHETLGREVIPMLEQAESSLDMIHRGLTAASQALAQIDRLPNVEAPPVADELQHLDQGVVEVNTKLDDVAVRLADIGPDGERIVAVTQAISDELTAARLTLASWTERTDAARAAGASAKASTPGLFDAISFGITLLALLLGAGQISLFLHVLQWFRAQGHDTTVARESST